MISNCFNAVDNIACNEFEYLSVVWVVHDPNGPHTVSQHMCGISLIIVYITLKSAVIDWSV